jgi:hypothetical protein
MSTREHWDKVYGTKGPDQVSWYRPHLEHSVDFIDRAGLDRNAAIIDVGRWTLDVGRWTLEEERRRWWTICSSGVTRT